ncbi:DUF2513 domain-containing protein [Priestia megaterium]|nr:DUF2513 domain-containing protein [Priestia megaterium]
MKRNKALMIEIMLRIELGEGNKLFITRELEPEMIDALYEHTKLLRDAGYVTYTCKHADDKLQFLSVSLTNQGYDYLEEIEAEEEANNNLSKAKSLITQGTNWTVTNIISPLLVEYTKSLVLPNK